MSTLKNSPDFNPDSRLWEEKKLLRKALLCEATLKILCGYLVTRVTTQKQRGIWGLLVLRAHGVSNGPPMDP